VRRTGPTNIVLRKLITNLRKASNKYNVPIWKYVSELLERPSRRRVVVNLSRIERYANEGEQIVVPGKVLGSGTLTKRVTIAAISFSETALNKIKETGGRPVSIEDLIYENPKGKGVKVIV